MIGTICILSTDFCILQIMEVCMAKHKKAERKREIDRRRKRKKERLKEKAKEQAHQRGGHSPA
jgi:hypothetical protein